MTTTRSSGKKAFEKLPANRRLGSIFNRDIDGLLYSSSGSLTGREEYTRMVLTLLQAEPGVLAMNVGMPDPVTYHSSVATTWDKYLTEVAKKVWPGSLEQGEEDHSASALKRLFADGTDCLKIAVEACRERGIAIVASYRMNAEDFYHGTTDLSDFGRENASLRIPGANCLDPAHPRVFQHRMDIFSEVVERFGIDGIEFDFRRWSHMISAPLENHPILTEMVRKTRKLLDNAAQKKGQRLLLGVRVGPTLSEKEGRGLPGGKAASDISCKDLGLDVAQWVEEELVDYICPSLFWPRLPGMPKTGEFAELARDRDIGIYPTVFPLPAWAEVSENSVPDGNQVRRLHRDEIVRAALWCYEEGADGISTYNWGTFFPSGTIERPPGGYSENYGRSCDGYQKVLMDVHPKLKNAEALRQYLESPLSNFLLQV